MVLDMGKPVSIDEIARMLAAKATRPVDIVYTGLRPGEKLHEDLLATGEPDVRPVHPLISHVDVPPVDPLGALGLDPWTPSLSLGRSIQALVGSVQPARGEHCGTATKQVPAQGGAPPEVHLAALQRR